MIKWLWKANQPQAEMLAQWREALNIPLLAPLNEEEQQRLVSVASHLLQQKLLGATTRVIINTADASPPDTAIRPAGHGVGSEMARWIS